MMIFFFFFSPDDFSGLSLFPFILRSGTKYSVAVFGMFDGGESLPLAGEEKTTLKDEPESPHVTLSGKSRQQTSLCAH